MTSFLSILPETLLLSVGVLLLIVDPFLKKTPTGGCSLAGLRQQARLSSWWSA